MRLDQGQSKLEWRAIDCNPHCRKQRLRACKWPRGGGLLCDPRRIFEDIGKRCDEVVLAARVKIGKAELRHLCLSYPSAGALAARCARLACQCCAICSRVGTHTRSWFKT